MKDTTNVNYQLTYWELEKKKLILNRKKETYRLRQEKIEHEEKEHRIAEELKEFEKNLEEPKEPKEPEQEEP